MIHVYWIEPTLNPSSISVDSSPKKIIEKPYCLSSSKKLNFDYHPVELDTICWGKQKPVQAMFWKSMEEFSSQTLKSVINPYPKVSTMSSPSNTRNYPTQDQRPVSLSHKSLVKIKVPHYFSTGVLISLSWLIWESLNNTPSGYFILHAVLSMYRFETINWYLIFRSCYVMTRLLRLKLQTINYLIRLQ